MLWGPQSTHPFWKIIYQTATDFCPMLFYIGYKTSCAFQGWRCRRGFIEICLAPPAERLCASELLKNCFLQKDKPIPAPAPPISVSLVSSVTKDGRQSASFMLWKGEFSLKGDMHVTDHVNLSLRFPDPSGCFNAEFPFGVDQDTSLSVAL